MSGFGLVALDVDGTLTDSRDQVTPRVAEAVRRTIAAGVAVVLATARSAPGALRVAERLGGPVGGVLINGALLFERLDQSPVEVRRLPAELAVEAAAVCRARGFDAFVWDDPTRSDAIVTDTPGAWEPQFVAQQRDKLKQVADLREWLDHDAMVLCAWGAEEPSRALQRELKGRFEGRATVTLAPYPPDGVWVLNVFAPDCSKWHGVQVLARRWGIAEAAVLAVGDGGNDLEMLRGAGLGVAMANAEPAVRAAADELVSDNDHDGVAEALERFVLDAATEGP